MFVVPGLVPTTNRIDVGSFFTRVRYIKRFRSSKLREWEIYHHVVQESLVSIEHIEESIDKFHDLFAVYPLLFYPFRLMDHGPSSGMLSCKKRYKDRDYGFYFDLAAYGIPPAVLDKPEKYNLVDNILELERYTHDKGGFLTPYTDIFFSREEYREMYGLRALEFQNVKLRLDLVVDLRKRLVRPILLADLVV